MIQVGDILVSEKAVTARFACDLGACLGACCRVGDVGASLMPGEIEEIEKALPVVIQTVPAENRERLQAGGFVDPSRPETPHLACFPDGRCVFAVPHGAFAAGTVGCSLEAAFLAGKTTFRKPLFCHLFPLRVEHFHGRRVLNLERRPECEPGYSETAGYALEFSREVLVRAFGAAWYAQCIESARGERERLRQLQRSR